VPGFDPRRSSWLLCLITPMDGNGTPCIAEMMTIGAVIEESSEEGVRLSQALARRLLRALRRSSRVIVCPSCARLFQLGFNNVDIILISQTNSYTSL
jgi:hypothetical protein